MKIANIETVGELQDALKFLESSGIYHPDTPLRFVSYQAKLQYNKIDELDVQSEVVRIELG